MPQRTKLLENLAQRCNISDVIKNAVYGQTLIPVFKIAFQKEKHNRKSIAERRNERKHVHR